MVDAPEVLTIIDSMPELSQFLNSLYNCQYDEFFKVRSSADVFDWPCHLPVAQHWCAAIAVSLATELTAASASCCSSWRRTTAVAVTSVYTVQTILPVATHLKYWVFRAGICGGCSAGAAGLCAGAALPALCARSASRGLPAGGGLGPSA